MAVWFALLEMGSLCRIDCLCEDFSSRNIFVVPLSHPPYK